MPPLPARTALSDALLRTSIPKLAELAKQKGLEAEDIAKADREQGNKVKQLADKALVYAYYSRARLFSDAARNGWAEPDLRSISAQA